MTLTTIHSKIQPKLKDDFVDILKLHRITTSKAINLLVKEVVYRNGITWLLERYYEEKKREGLEIKDMIR